MSVHSGPVPSVCVSPVASGGVSRGWGTPVHLSIHLSVLWLLPQFWWVWCVWWRGVHLSVLCGGWEGQSVHPVAAAGMLDGSWRGSLYVPPNQLLLGQLGGVRACARMPGEGGGGLPLSVCPRHCWSTCIVSMCLSVCPGWEGAWCMQVGTVCLSIHLLLLRHLQQLGVSVREGSVCMFAAPCALCPSIAAPRAHDGGVGRRGCAYVLWGRPG